VTPRFLPEVRPSEWNYVIGIHGAWMAGRYRFMQRYRSGMEHNLGEEFDACPCRELRPRILMVETAKNFDRGDPTDAPNGSRKRRVLIERQMSPRRIVIRDVR
jgi:hypothetical protein